MSLVIDLPQPIEARIEQEAQRSGMSASEVVAYVIREKFATAIDTDEQKRLNAPSIALLESWLAEAEKPRTAEELLEAEDDLADLMRNLNTTRQEAGERLLFPNADEKA